MVNTNMPVPAVAHAFPLVRDTRYLLLGVS